MLKRIKIRGFRSLNTEVSLAPLTIIYGGRASGKTNFLDALALLSSLTTTTVQDAVVRDSPPALGNFFYLRRPEELIEREFLQIIIEAHIDTVSSGNSKRRTPSASFYYRVVLTARPSLGELVVSEEELWECQKDSKVVYQVSHNHLMIMNEKGKIGKWDNRRTIISLPLSPPHYPRIVTLQQELRQWRIYTHPNWQAMTQPSPLRHDTHLMPGGSNLAGFLHTMSTS